MEQNKTDTEIIEELLQTVKTLHEENARLHLAISRFKMCTDNLFEVVTPQYLI